MQTDSLGIQDYVQEQQANIFTLSVPEVDQSDNSNLHYNFYPGYKGIDLTPTDKRIIQSITVLFESWQAWQRHILFSGLIHRFSKSQLKNLKTAVEPLRHRDFITVCKHAYPMHKIREKQLVHYRDIRRLVKKHNSPAAIANFLAQTENDFRLSDHTKSEFELKNHSGKTSKQRKTQKLRHHESATESIHKQAQTTPAISQVFSKNEFQSLTNADTLNSTKKKSTKRSSMISLPSVWAMGEGVQKLEDAESDFQSRISPINKPSDTYFPHISNNAAKAKFATTPSKAKLDQFMTG